MRLLFPVLNPIPPVLGQCPRPCQTPALANRTRSPAELFLVLCSAYSRNEGAAPDVSTRLLDPVARVLQVQLEVAALYHFAAVRARAKLLEFLSSLGHSHPGSVCGAVFLEMTAAGIENTVHGVVVYDSYLQHVFCVKT